MLTVARSWILTTNRKAATSIKATTLIKETQTIMNYRYRLQRCLSFIINASLNQKLKDGPPTNNIHVKPIALLKSHLIFYMYELSRSIKAMNKSVKGNICLTKSSMTKIVYSSRPMVKANTLKCICRELLLIIRKRYHHWPCTIVKLNLGLFFAPKRYTTEQLQAAYQEIKFH